MIPASFRKRSFFLALFTGLVGTSAIAQMGSIKATFTPTNGNGGKSVTMQLSIPILKFDNPHGFWFVNPHTGDRHMQFMPDAGYGDRASDVAFITINETKNDYEFYSTGKDDSDDITFENKIFLISPPAYNLRASINTPLHVHINSFTASEISFTISGAARSLVKNGGKDYVTGTIEGAGHLYRDPKYLQSDVMPGCNCDPTIYAKVFDEDNNIRTPSACESALSNKVFDAVRNSMASLFTNVAHGDQGKPVAGDINISMIAGHANIDVPAKDRPWCSSDYQHFGLTGINAHKVNYESTDRFGLRFIKLPSNDELGLGTDGKASMMRQIAAMDSLSKLMAAKKITPEQEMKAMKDLSERCNAGAPDIKKAEVEHNLYIYVYINPIDKEQLLIKLADAGKASVEHNIKGSAYEIFAPQWKDTDGGWISNRMLICMGKFAPAVSGKSGGGFNAEISKPIYPASGNKLTVYNIVIRMEGAKDMMDQAVRNIDFNALQELISKQ